MYSVQFQKVDGSNLQLSDIVVIGHDKYGQEVTGNGKTSLWTWDGSKYDAKVFYYPDGERFADPEKTIPVAGAGWALQNHVATNFEFAVGTGFWVKSTLGTSTYKDVSLTICGQVFNPGSDVQYYSYSIPRNKQWMLSSPFPDAAFSLDDVFVWSTEKEASKLGGNGKTSVWGWNGSKYNSKIFYYPDGQRWADPERTIPVAGAGWATQDHVATNVVISAGESFWLKTTLGDSSTTPQIRFANPFYEAK